MLLAEPGRPLRAAELPVPEPAEGQVLIEALACGACRKRPAHPRRRGHAR